MPLARSAARSFSCVDGRGCFFQPIGCPTSRARFVWEGFDGEYWGSRPPFPCVYGAVSILLVVLGGKEYDSLAIGPTRDVRRWNWQRHQITTATSKRVDDVSFTVARRSASRGFLKAENRGGQDHYPAHDPRDHQASTSGSNTTSTAPSALEVRQRIGYLPEEKGLYKKMKAWSVIAYFATLKGLTKKAAKQRAFELLERYGLKDFATKPTDALSVSRMGQKVQMLASDVDDPEFVILDEPFSGLDPVNQQVMEEIIRDMAGRRRTILFSTHVMQHAERLCQRILLMAKGRKIFDGTIAEAKRTLPRRVRIETDDDVGPLRQLNGVISVGPVETAGPNGSAHWELQIGEKADPQAILQLCFAKGIRLRGFSQNDPTLHDVFMRLVGPEAREAAFPMRFIFLVACREYIENARTKGFWIGLCMFPMIIFVSVKVSILLETKGMPVRYYVMVGSNRVSLLAMSSSHLERSWQPRFGVGNGSHGDQLRRAAFPGRLPARDD